jgi:zinc transport system substrate-binding protein
MKYTYFLFALLTVSLLSCNPKSKETEKPIIMVSILPQKYFVEEIAGDKFEVNLMIPPGASPATYDPTPRQMQDMANANLYFKIGYIGFELNWINRVANDYPDVSFINSSDGIDFKETEEQHGDHSHYRLEPHVWMSPKNVKVISANILKAVTEADPENSDFYQSNYKIFLEKITMVDEKIKSKLTNIQSRDFIIYHPALTYYARDYDLNQYSLEIDGKEPSVKQMTELIKLAKEKNIKVIFVQSQFNQEEARTLEKEINGTVYPIDPLDYHWEKQILSITDILSEQLK